MNAIERTLAEKSIPELFEQIDLTLNGHVRAHEDPTTKVLFEALPHLRFGEIVNLLQQLSKLTPIIFEELGEHVEREVKQRIKAALYGDWPERELVCEPITKVKIEKPLNANHHAEPRLVIYGDGQLKNIFANPPRGGKSLIGDIHIVFGNGTAYISLRELPEFIRWVENSTYSPEVVPGLIGLADEGPTETVEEREARLEKERLARQAEIERTLREQTEKIRAAEQDLRSGDSYIASLLDEEQEGTEPTLPAQPRSMTVKVGLPPSSGPQRTYTARLAQDPESSGEGAVSRWFRRSVQGRETPAETEARVRRALGTTVLSMAHGKIATGEHPVAKDERVRVALQPEQPEITIQSAPIPSQPRPRPMPSLTLPPLTEEEKRVDALKKEADLKMRGIAVWAERLEEIVTALDEKISEQSLRDLWKSLISLKPEHRAYFWPRWILVFMKKVFAQHRLAINIDSAEILKSGNEIECVFIGDESHISAFLKNLEGVTTKNIGRVTTVTIPLSQIVKIPAAVRQVLGATPRLAQLKADLGAGS